MKTSWIAIVLGMMAMGCGGASGGGGSPNDMATAKPGDMAVLLSQCGMPGDKGNSIGVGKYCTSIADCAGGNMKTNICSALGNGANPSADDTYFCTVYPCHLDGGMAECGENATCTCGSGGGMTGCACTPNSCLSAPKDGGTDSGK